MIICPNCKNQELTGAIFCSACGAQISQSSSSVFTQQISMSAADETPTRPTMGDLRAASTTAPVTLQLENGEMLSLADKMEFTLGRVSDNQPIMPDVDLSRFNAYENGVSRLHAVIKIEQRKVTLMDLGSANGTYINGIRIAANTPQQLRHGDSISIGKLKMQVILS